VGSPRRAGPAVIADRTALLARGLGLEHLTVAWNNLIEGRAGATNLTDAD